jgi:hypothetical protein
MCNEWLVSQYSAFMSASTPRGKYEEGKKNLGGGREDFIGLFGSRVGGRQISLNLG